MNNGLRRLLPMFAGCVAIICLAACVASRQAEVADPAVRGGVTVHAWRAISMAPMESWSGPRTALYTYVLVGDVGPLTQNIDAATQRAWLALEQLLKEVQAGEQIGPEDAARWPREVLMRANQFCIPAASAAPERVEPRTYDLARSHDYLNLFRLAVLPNDAMTRSLEGLGPFLVSTRKPIGEIISRNAQGALTIDTDSPVLVVDMTGANAAAMPAYVLAFRQVVRKEVASSTSIKPLRALFASAVLDLNEAVPLVAEAYAGTKKLFE